MLGRKSNYPPLKKRTHVSFICSAMDDAYEQEFSYEYYPVLCSVHCIILKTIWFTNNFSVLVQSIISLSIYSFMYLCIHGFIYLFIYLFVYLCIHVFMYLCIYSFIYSFIQSVLHSFIHSFLPSFIHLFIYLFIILFYFIFFFHFVLICTFLVQHANSSHKNEDKVKIWPW